MNRSSWKKRKFSNLIDLNDSSVTQSIITIETVDDSSSIERCRQLRIWARVKVLKYLEGVECIARKSVVEGVWVCRIEFIRFRQLRIWARVKVLKHLEGVVYWGRFVNGQSVCNDLIWIFERELRQDNLCYLLAGLDHSSVDNNRGLWTSNPSPYQIEYPIWPCVQYWRSMDTKI